MTAGEAPGRRVLVVGSIWPYHSGGARVPGLAKYLPECGWEPVVLAWPLPPAVRLPYRVEVVGGSTVGENLAHGLHLDGEGGMRRSLARRLHVSSESEFVRMGFTVMREVLEYPDGYRAWRRAALQRALELLRDEHFDAVISTSPPISTHLIAAELKRCYGLTWVADFPHLWSQDHGVPYGRVRRSFDRHLEVRTLSGADVLTTIVPPLAEQLGTLHGSGRVVTIEHGFDPERLNTRPDPVTKEFTITYTGGWSAGVREPRMTLAVLRHLLDSHIINRDMLRVRFYGPAVQWVQDQIEASGLHDVVTQYGVIPQSEAFARQRESQVLLIPKGDTALEGMISSKFYEYLAGRRPILAIGGHEDIVNEKLEETGAGVACESSEQAATASRTYYGEYLASGVVGCHSDLAAVMRYSHRAMAKQFASLLDSRRL
jgi:hypothetical protein